jgi:hypothetical protein
LAASRRMGHRRSRPSIETPRKRAAPQDEDGVRCAEAAVLDRSEKVLIFRPLTRRTGARETRPRLAKPKAKRGGQARPL